MAFRIAFRQRTGSIVIVGDDGSALSDRFAPKARGLDRIHEGLVGDSTLCHGGFGPRVHRENTFIVVEKSQITDCTLGQPYGLLQSKIRELLQRFSCHFVQLQQHMQALFV